MEAKTGGHPPSSVGGFGASADENKAIVGRLVEEWQGGRRPEVAEQILAEDFVDHSTKPRGPPAKERGIQFFHYLWQAFPDFSTQIEYQIAEGDFVATLKTFREPRTASSWVSLRPAGTLPFDVFDLLCLRDGKVVEQWNVTDSAGLMQQLGNAPALGGSAR